MTHLGGIVIIADERTQPAAVVHSGLMLPEAADAEARALAQHVSQKTAHGAWDAEVKYPITSVVISRADGMAHVTQDGSLLGSFPVRIANKAAPIGTHVYSLVGPAADGSALTWLALGTGKKPTDAHVVTWQGDTALRRIAFYDRKRAIEIARSFHPGTALTLTDSTAPRPTRTTPKDFSVIASEPPAG